MVRIEMADVEVTAKKLADVMYKFPDEVNKFMQQEVNGMKQSIKKEEDPRWTTKITHSKYIKQWIPFNRARYSKSSERDGIKSWWIINNKMFYERFVNDGHAVRRVKRGPDIAKKLPHPATHHIEKGVKNYEGTMFSNMDKFCENLMKL